MMHILIQIAALLCLFTLCLGMLAISTGLRSIHNELRSIKHKLPQIDQDPSTIQHTIEHYAWTMGRSFEQGRRTDR